MQSSILDQLRPKHRRFVEEYVVDFNGSKAATRAGYSRKSARIQASQLLAIPNIEASVEYLAKSRAHRLELTSERVLQEIGRICYASAKNLFDPRGRRKKPHELDDDTAAAIAGMETKRGKTKVRFWSKTEALNMAGRYLKLFKEDAPTQPQAGMFVLLAPATATPDEWMKLAQQHAGVGK
jgi:phage terminase small subunit